MSASGISEAPVIDSCHSQTAPVTPPDYVTTYDILDPSQCKFAGAVSEQQCEFSENLLATASNEFAGNDIVQQCQFSENRWPTPVSSGIGFFIYLGPVVQ